MACKTLRRAGKKRLQMVINKIVCARRCSLTCLVCWASANGPWRVLCMGSVSSCLSSQSSLSVWRVHSFSSHRWESLWSPTDFSTRHDIKQEPLTLGRGKTDTWKGQRVTRWRYTSYWFDGYCEKCTVANAYEVFYCALQLYVERAENQEYNEMAYKFQL